MRESSKKRLNLQKLISGVISGDIVSLSKAITIIESDNINDESNSKKIISSCIKEKSNSIRIGINYDNRKKKLAAMGGFY